jgi:regulator of protease activity HflC (stomatin/prohibitin superfamily)
MEALFEWLINLIESFWPFSEVEPWECGVYIVNGKCKKVVGPGYLWPVTPWVSIVHLEPVSVVPAILGTPMMSVITRDGEQVTYSVCCQVRVVDAVAALTQIDDYEETTQELVAAVTAEALGMMSSETVHELRRTELAKRLVPKLNKELNAFGVEADDLWFTNLVPGVRTYRLLQDEALTGGSW